jgi:hypothetical protein
MADPLSAISALAAASQLAEQCLKITLFLCEMRSKFRKSRDFIDMSAQQVDQLMRISRQIILNPSLQTKTIAGVLEACLNEARGLHKFLQGVTISSKDSRMARFKKTLMALRIRQAVEAQSENIEKWKGLLALCISETNSCVF